MISRTKKELKQRIQISVVILAMTMLVLAGRLWYLQIIRGAEFALKSEANALRVVPIPAPRGIIYDRNQVPLANNRMAFTVMIMPRDLPKNPEPVFQRLSQIIGLSVSEIKEAISSRPRLPYYPVYLVRDVGPEIVTQIEENRLDLPGVAVYETPVRNYPFQDLAGHTLGYLGIISENQLREINDPRYSGSDFVGRTGLEWVYETELRGVDGGQQVEVNRVSRPIRVLGTAHSIPGRNLILTLDVELQQVAETVLQERLAAIRSEGRYERAFAGSVVALDPRTGQILAMASEPGFDPSQFVGGVSPSYWREIVNNPYDPLRNRVIQGDITPGSVFKVVTAMAALSEGRTTPWEYFKTTGRDTTYPQKTCWIYPGNHGVINVAQGLRDSCNIVFYELGRRVGIDSLYEWSRWFGLGEKTGLNIYPAESNGLVPNRQWKQEYFKRRDQQVWYPIETLDVSIGQGPLLTTPLQMAVLYAALANGGTLYEPYLVQAILEPTGEVVEIFEPAVKRELNLQPSALTAVRDGMRQVITSGTARRVFEGFPITTAGKSGTAELHKGTVDVHGWFACYAPVDNPEIVVVVALERAGGGSSSAAPIARKVLEEYFGIEPPEEDLEVDAATVEPLISEN